MHPQEEGRGPPFCCHNVRRPYDWRRSDCTDRGVHTEHNSGVRVPGGSALGSSRLCERQVGPRPLPGLPGAIKRDKCSAAAGNQAQPNRPQPRRRALAKNFDSLPGHKGRVPRRIRTGVAGLNTED
jgi:hypothetical protein